MDQETTGTYRVLPGRTDDEWLLIDQQTVNPVYVPRTDTEMEVGNLLEATLCWEESQPLLDSVTVIEETKFRFLRTDEPIFEAAQACFEEARAAGEAMNARVTYSTDNQENGVLYTFAEQSGQRDLFGEFRDGQKPLEPLLGRTAETVEPPFSVWVLDVNEPFVLVYIVLDPTGMLEETMCEAYL